MANALMTLTGKLAAKLDMGSGGQELIDTLKATAFKGGQVNDAQMTALLVIANQYALNPWTKEIFAFPDKGGIVPVVGLDGWSRIINTHPQMDGIDFEQSDDACTCITYRKDRSRPTKVTEFMDECRRGTGPWQSHPRRMLRHKALIQCARLAFGFAGIYDQDEAERLIGAQDQHQPAAKPERQPYPDEKLAENLDSWHGMISDGKKTADQLIAFLETRFTLTAEQKEKISAIPADFDAETGEVLEGEVV